MSLRHGGADEAVHQRLLAVIDRQVNHMARMVDDLRDLSRTAPARCAWNAGRSTWLS